ncbi:MAG: hypothetical protein CR988_03065 [Treponema sp.]|nr:MAG: hypothetical protein CR988_03065 [Treponema sp.]
MKINNFSKVLLIALMFVVIFYIGCKSPVDSDDNTGSSEKVQKSFVKITPISTITPPTSGIGSILGTDNYYKGVFLSGRKVTLSSYCIAEAEVTYKLWKEVYDWAVEDSDGDGFSDNGYKFANIAKKGGKKSSSSITLTDEHPVTNISWRDCIVWCNAYTEKTKGADDCVYRDKDDHTKVLKDATETSKVDSAYAYMSKKGYRLPTEAEWEYGARWQGSTATNGVKFSNIYLTALNSLSGATGDCNNGIESSKVAIYNQSSTAPVKSKASNGLGLYDMSGNVWEFCFDLYNDNAIINDSVYETGSGSKKVISNPQGSTSGTERVAKGGDWQKQASYASVGIRFKYTPGLVSDLVGFRLVFRP